MKPACALLSHCIDYAGLFPPAALDLQTVVENYAAYRAGSDAWALGRLILPAAKIAEFVARWPRYAQEWSVTPLLRGDLAEEIRAAEAFGKLFDAIECKPLPASDLHQMKHLLSSSGRIYVEVDSTSDPERTIATLAESGARAKIRTGGVTENAIPSPAHVARFLAACVKHRVAWKATAGLHHAVRGSYPLTYAADSGKASMHGFLNVLLASAFLFEEGNLFEATQLLEESSLESFSFSEEGVRWSEWTISSEQFNTMRREAMISFGSCSFAEPLEEMRAGGLLQ